MKWEKLGRVYVADPSLGWASGWAMLPTTLLLDDGDRIRVFVACLDSKSVGRIGFVDLDARNPLRVLRVSRRPVLDIGSPGSFDDHGVNPLSVVDDDGTIRLYYVGWQLGVDVRYFLFVGLALSGDGGETFERYSRVPVFERSDRELLVRTGAHVQKFEHGWRAWYAGGSSFTTLGDKSQPTYELRYLESSDGLNWGPDGEVCLEMAGKEFGFGRPFVRAEGDRMQMWYSIRSHDSGYRIGYGESFDGRNWRRLDEDAGIDVSNDGWDSEMIAFPCIARTPHGEYLFYNGNGYGATGFGVAVARG